MFRLLPISACLMTAFIGITGGLFAEEQTWVFEGVVSEADPILAPDLKSGWVLSGSFLMDPLAMEEDNDLKSDRSGRLTGGVSDTELTIDLYYQLHFQGLQVPGIVGFDYTNDDPQEDGRDLLGWFFPMRGKVKDSGWSLRWLQIWLIDREGDLIRTTPPPVSPTGLSWKSSWFRLIFVNEENDEAYLEGNLEYFAPESSMEKTDEANRWNTIVADLGDQLQQRDSLIAAMKKDLEESLTRVDSLRRMVDLLVEERKSLQEENALLGQKVQPDNSALEGRVADLTAEKALAEQNLADMKTRNLALAETLGESELVRRRLQEQLAELTSVNEGTLSSPASGKSQGKVLSPDGKEVGNITIIERPMVIEKPVGGFQASERDRSPQNAKLPEKAERKSRFGPRKFR